MPTSPDARPRWPPLALAAWGVLFLAAATFNAGGYRYGASDQAFYIPAVLHHLDQSLFPRDWALLAPQDRLSLFTALAGGAAQLTGASVPALFFALYLAGLLALFALAIALGTRLYQSRWTIVALAFALTLRHALAMGAVNTLEGYMHPRILAFGLGGLAVAECLASRPWRAAAFVGLAAVCHPTTALWFLLWTGVAAAVADRRWRRPLLAAAAVAVAAGAWAVAAGPLAGRLTLMDDEWLSVLASKTYFFPTRWPVSGWIPAILTPLTAAVLYRARWRAGLATPAERGVAVGAAVLFAVFLGSIPFVAARLALAVQLQVPRTLWMVDLLAVAYIVWYFAEGAPWAGIGDAGQTSRAEAPLLPMTSGRTRAARATALVFIALSLGRGAWVMVVQHPERAAVHVGLPDSEWHDAMRWVAANTAKEAWVLAPPGHAWKYQDQRPRGGTTQRVPGRIEGQRARDVPPARRR